MAFIASVAAALVAAYLFLSRTTLVPPLGSAVPGRTSAEERSRELPTAHEATPAPSAAKRPCMAPPCAPRTRERQALRQRILESVAARQAATTTRQTAALVTGGARGVDSRGATDRSGNLGQTAQVINRELIPLIDDCEEQAQERAPLRRGKFTLLLDIVGDEELGGVIESVRIQDSNSVADEELLTCLRESTLSISLPPPRRSGRDGIQLTLQLGEQPK